MNPDPTQIQILDDQKLQHFSFKKNQIIVITSCNFLRPSRRTSMLNEKPPVLQREHPALQCNSFTFFLFNGYSCAFLDPDLQTQLNLDTVRILVRNTANFHVFANSLLQRARDKAKTTLRSSNTKRVCSQASRHCPFTQLVISNSGPNKEECMGYCSIKQRAPGM
jgi:hypothetical protein